jgi:hypothetical protein
METKRRIGGLTLLCCLAPLTVGCGRTGVESGDGRLAATGAEEHSVHSETETFLVSPLFHDEQRLMVRTASGFVSGPKAKIEVLADLEEGWTANQARGVALIHIIQDGNLPPPPPFPRYGYWCLLLREVSGVEDGGHGWQWTAWRNDSEARARTVCRANSAGGATWQRVQHAHGPAGSSVAPVARWDWDNAAGRPYIGVRCGSRWCEISDSGITPSDSTPFGGRHYLKGWGDEQFLHLASGPNQATVPVLATIVPEPGFKWQSGNTNYQLAARISLRLMRMDNATPPPSGWANNVALAQGVQTLATDHWKDQSFLLPQAAEPITYFLCLRAASGSDATVYVRYSRTNNCRGGHEIEFRREAHPRAKVHTDSIYAQQLIPEMLRAPTGIPGTRRWGNHRTVGLQGWIECSGCCKPAEALD